jgi:dipeptidase E
MTKSLLLLSSSRVDDTEYLSHALPIITDFLAHKLPSADNHGDRELLFIPYAGVTINYDQYEAMVSAAFAAIGYTIKSIHHHPDPVAAIDDAQAIVVGGGNTFELLSKLYENSVLARIKEKVESGTPYIGWSAGSNIAGPTIKTTNDMPIVEPPSFQALNLVSFQINPHYIDGSPPGHNGETREQRLQEFLTINTSDKVVGIPEGTGLLIRSNELSYVGNKTAFYLSSKGKIAFDTSQQLRELIAG